ncbi:MAG: glycine--tRNA ligase subunit beta [Roseinatronobacter sp.]|nr:glycine--tRNA ligase subunit beta [Roseinatronobacter sp.]
MADLLIELFSEEIPARMQASAAEALKRLVTEGLVSAGLTYAHAGAFATPRRLALAVQGLSAHSPTLREERKGPKLGAPQAAIDGFLRGIGQSMADLDIRDDKKGQVYFATITTPGRAAPEIVAEVLETTIRNFPWPKSMRWGSGSLRWVRPLHSILCILSTEAGAEIVPLTVDGIAASDSTRGHRFMAPDAFAVTGFDDYAAKLKRAHVILDPQERAAHIWNDASQMAFAAGLELIEDKALLAEVAGLVEWPVVLMGRIAADFLNLPAEVLQTSMREHQKFFSARDPKSGQIVGFVTVANRDTADKGATILKGNQKVLAARLSDAKFFWENDLRTVTAQGLDGMGAGLANVTFHNKLGSQADRVARIAALAREIAPLVGADADLAEQAARVAKADLRSDMVGEFPELQGLMGSYYARAAGLSEDVARACVEHYQPLGPSDSVPSAPVSVAVALADKIDTLTGFWAIDEKPTGSKDPYALRRAALGVIRLVLGKGVKLPLGLAVHHANNALSDQWFAKVDRKREQLADYASNSGITLEKAKAVVFKSVDEKVAEDVLLMGFEMQWAVAGQRDNLIAFFHDRLKTHLRDQGIRHDVIDACLAMPGNDDLTLLVKRAEALSAFLKTADGENLLQGFKRANNILTKEEAKDGVEYSFGPDPKLAETPEEKALFTALDTAEAAITPAMTAEDFATAMAAMASLRAPIDAFFDSVQINTDNQIVRRNRLNLLHRIRATCQQGADLTRVEG